MRKFFLAAIAAFVLFYIHTPALAGSKLVNLLLDTGPGGALFRDPVYDKRAAVILKGILADVKLAYGDTLSLRTFGNPSMMDQVRKQDWNREILFSYRGAKVDDVPSFIDKQMAGLSHMQADAQSDLMHGLDNLATAMACDTHDVTTVIMSNGIETGQVSGNSFTLNRIPRGTPFCGRVVFLGLWVIDPNPVPGMKTEAERLFVNFAKKVGFTNVQIKR